MSNDREIGSLEARMKAVEEDIKEIRDDVREMLMFMQQARGSWKTVMGIAGASATFGAIIAKFLPNIPLR